MALTAEQQRRLKELEALDAHDARVQELEAMEPYVPEVTEEQSPDVSFGQRMLIKNLSNSPDVGVEYLKQKGMDAQVIDGNIYVKDPKDGKLKALDPKGLDLQDITDLAYDIPAGAATGIATAAGGLGGATVAAPTVVGIPAGAALGASSAGAASSAGLEALRQKLGSYLGLPQEVSGKDVAISGALGAASPLLFGTGATGAQVLKSAVKSQIPAEALKQSQRSVLTRAVGKVATPALSGATGISNAAIKAYSKYGNEVDDMIASEGGAEMAEGVHKELMDSFYKKQNEVGKKLENTIKGSPNLISRDKIFEPIESEIQVIVNSELSQTPSGQEQILALRAEVDKLKAGLPEEIKPETAWLLRDNLYKMSSAPHDAPLAQKLVSKAAKASSSAADREMKTAANSAGAAKDYADIVDLRDGLNKYFKDPAKTYSTLSGLERPSKEFQRKMVNAAKDKLGVDLKKPAEQIEAYRHFRDLNYAPSELSLKGAREPVAKVLQKGMQASRYVRSKTPDLIPIAPARLAPMTVAPWARMKSEEEEY